MHWNLKIRLMRTAYGGFWRHIKYDGKNIVFVSTYPCIMKPHSPLTMHIPHSVGRGPYWSSPPRPQIVGRRPYWSSPPRPHPSPTAPHMVAAMVGYRAIRQGVYRSYVGGHIGAVFLGHIPTLPLHIWWQRWWDIEPSDIDRECTGATAGGTQTFIIQ